MAYLTPDPNLHINCTVVQTASLSSFGHLEDVMQAQS